MSAATPEQAAARAFVTGCVARGLTASQASVPPEGQLSTVRGLWADVAQAVVDAATEGSLRACGYTLADVGRFLEAEAAAREPRAAEVDAAFAGGMRVRTGPCTVEAHDREHFQVRTNGHWLCGHLLASVLAAQGIVASQEPHAADEADLRERARAILAAVTEYDPLADVPAPELARLLALVDLAEAAKANYGGYRSSSRGRSLISGSPLPEYEQQAEAVQGAWRAGAEGVIALLADHLAESVVIEGLNPQPAPEVAALRELLDEIGVMAANAPEDGDSFGLLEEIAMRAAAAGIPDAADDRDRLRLAGAKVAEARKVIGNFLAHYGDSDILMFKVGIDLANSLRKVLGDDDAARDD